MASWTLFLSRKRLARSRCLLTSTAMDSETFSYRRFFRRRKRQSHPPAWGIRRAETYLLYTSPAPSAKTTALRPCGIGQGPLHSSLPANPPAQRRSGHALSSRGTTHEPQSSLAAQVNLWHTEWLSGAIGNFPSSGASFFRRLPPT